jgi:hypothetical protein
MAVGSSGAPLGLKAARRRIPDELPRRQRALRVLELARSL